MVPRSSFLLFFLPGFGNLGLTHAQSVSVPLTAENGVALRLYLTQRLPMRVGGTASAKLIEPVYAFDRVVIPAGAEVTGRITSLKPASKLVRTQAILGGNFTPLHWARVEFTEIKMPDGRTLAIHTQSSIGLPSIYEPPKTPRPPKTPPTPKANQTSGSNTLKARAMQELKTQANSQIVAQLGTRTYGLGTLVRGPNKKERLEDLGLAKLPYRPQWYRRGTRFDALLEDSLDFGNASLPADSLRELGSSSSFDQAAQVRFLSDVSSATAKAGDPVEAVLSQPLTADGVKLVLPEGTRLSGAVRQARRARWFHRSGQLRFTFDRIVLPAAVASLPPHPPERSEARLETAETDPAAAVKIDSEGSAKATESKARFLKPVLAALVAVKSMDNDTGKQTAEGGNASPNTAGLALGGFSGFGLLGAALSRTSSITGSALGMYGMAGSIFANVISRGHEVEFKPNSSMEIRFGARAAPEANKP